MKAKQSQVWLVNTHALPRAPQTVAVTVINTFNDYNPRKIYHQHDCTINIFTKLKVLPCMCTCRLATRLHQAINKCAQCLARETGQSLRCLAYPNYCRSYLVYSRQTQCTARAQLLANPITPKPRVINYINYMFIILRMIAVKSPQSMPSVMLQSEHDTVRDRS